MMLLLLVMMVLGHGVHEPSVEEIGKCIEEVIALIGSIGLSWRLTNRLVDA